MNKNFRRMPEKRARGWLVFLLMTAAAGCLSSPPESLPTSPAVTVITPTIRPTSTPAPSLPPSPVPFQNDGKAYTVVGIGPGETLTAYQRPAPESPAVGMVPRSGLGIQAGDQQQGPGGRLWRQIRYADLQGWVPARHLAEQQGRVAEELILLGGEVLLALKHKNYQQLTDLVHPQLCLRFSPYPTLVDRDRVFCPQRLWQLWEDQSLSIWGVYDGTGELIQMTFAEYHQEFIYDLDFFQAEVVGYNEEVSTGNAINNIEEVYPEAQFIEYYFSGVDPQYAGLDWRSLKLVFVNQDGAWYLTALVHGEWTI